MLSENDPTAGRLPGFVLRWSYESPQDVNYLAWSPDGSALAVACDDGNVRVLDAQSGDVRSTLERIAGQTTSVWALALAWSPDSRLLATAGGGDENAIGVWDAATGERRERFTGHDDIVRSLAWSPDGRQLVSSSYDRTARLWYPSRVGGDVLGLPFKGDVLALAWSRNGVLALGCRGPENAVCVWQDGEATVVGSHVGDVLGLAWSGDGQLLASSSEDRTIRIWDPGAGLQTGALEAHTGGVSSVSFSADGRFLASKSGDDTIRLWRCDTWETIAVFEETASRYLGSNAAFHPDEPVLATLGLRDRLVRLWELDPALLLRHAPDVRSAHYTNAKVVLVGDSGVGKSGLGLVLAGQEFERTESTHGRRVWTVETATVELEDGREESRELLLWDLAGQPGYRLIHQLHLREAAAALIVFDARSETDPFAGVQYWERALRQARLADAVGVAPLKKFLVAARVDRGGIAASPERIEAFTRELGFDAFFSTSAKEGWAIPELAEAIRTAIAWESLPKVSSTELFLSLKTFLVREKADGRVLSTADDLYRAYLRSPEAPAADDGLRAQFETCVGLVEAQGLIRRLGFGNLVLLQPELLDAYAAAIVNAAKEEPDGMGSIAEEAARSGSFRMSDSERITDGVNEQLLLIATIEDLLRHEIALREQADSGPLLIFPSQFTRENPDLPDPEGKAVVFEFDGPVLSVYTTLVVRLAHSGIFTRPEMWKNAATYEAPGGRCGIFLQETDEGHAELTLFFSGGASEETKSQFEQYVHTHLLRRAIADTIKRRLVITCVCGYVLTDQVIRLRRERGYDWLDCPVCSRRISFADTVAAGEAGAPGAVVPDIDRAADARRDLEASVSRVQGKVVSGEFDVFLAHNSLDKPQVEAVARALRERGLNPWLDKEQIAPGRRVQDVIQTAIPMVKSAAVFIGTEGLGKWEALELRAFISRCVKADLPVIPVILPGVERLPDDLPFLQEMGWVRFTSTVDEPVALDELEWGITGVHPQRPAPASDDRADGSDETGSDAARKG